MKTRLKALSPIIATILLVVIAVILVSAILSFGKSFTAQGLDKTKDIKELSKSDAEHFIYPKTFSDGVMQFNYSPPNNFGDINITKYKILYDNNETEEVTLDTAYTLKTGTNLINLKDFSDQNVTTKKFTLILETEDNKYVTLKNITNPYPYVPEPYVPQAYVAGPLSPGTASNDDSIGAGAWANIDAIIEGDTEVAFFSPGCWVTGISNYIKVTNFGFNIPSEATIDGLKIEVYKGVSYIPVQDYRVNIIKSNGTISSENYSKSGNWPGGYNEHFEYGGSSDKWGETWTAEDINDSDFGVAISVIGADEGDCGIARIDYVTITVYYTN